MPPIWSRRIYFIAELSITHEDPSKINQLIVAMRYLGKQRPHTLGRWAWTATSDRARTRQRTQAMIFPSHASNTPRHGRYLRLKMARFREQRWAYARSWPRCDWTSLSYREGKLNLPPPPTDRERVQRVNIRTNFRALQRLLCILSMFMNSLLYAAWDVFFWVFSGTTWRTEKDSPFHVTATKPSLIVN